MLELLKKFWYWYNRFWWVVGIGKSELMKPLTLLNETAWIVLLIGNYGIKVGIVAIILGNIAILTGIFVAGLIFLYFGTIKLNTRLGNTQNVEFMELYGAIKRVEGIVNQINERRGATTTKDQD